MIQITLMTLLSLLKKQEGIKPQILPLRKGDILCHEGEVCHGVYLVLKGAVKISSYALNGEEIIYNYVEEGGIFGNNLVFASDPSFRGNVIAAKVGEIVFISKDQLVHLLQSDKEFLKEYLRLQSDFGKNLNAKLKLLSFSLAEDRLVFYLQQQGKSVTFGRVSALAESLFMKRETLSRLLHRMEAEGKIKLSKGRIEYLGN